MAVKLLIMIDWFSPGYKAGGPIQSCMNVSLALKDDLDVNVLTSDTDLGVEVPYPGIESDKWINNIDKKINIFYSEKRSISYKKLKKVILELSPDVIYLNSMYSTYFVLLPLWMMIRNQIDAKIVLCPRGALYESALNVKRYKKIPFLKLFRWLGIHKRILFHATNNREMEAIIKYFPGSEVVVAEDFPRLIQNPYSSLGKQRGELKLVYISRIHPIKNLGFVIEVLKKLKSNIYFTIVGPVEDESYWDLCKQAINKLPVNIKVKYEGSFPSHLLDKFVIANHLFILPTLGENFGHAIFESLLAGRPVLISDQTPWRRLNSDKVGWDLSLEDHEGFFTALQEASNWDQNEFDEYGRSAWSYADKFVREVKLKQQYLQLFS